MKILEKVRKEVESKILKMDWKEEDVKYVLTNALVDVLIDEVPIRYATEYAKEALKNASENAILIKESQYTGGLGLSGLLYEDTLVLDKQSILSEDNLPKHR